MPPEKLTASAWAILVLLGLLMFDDICASYGTANCQVEFASYGTIGTPSYQYSGLKRYAYGNPWTGNEDANSIASNYDISQSWYISGPLIQRIHAIRPDYIALLYRNIAAVYFDENVPSSWILKDANGNRVYYRDWPTTDFYVDIGNPDFQGWVANWIANYVNQYGFSGVMVDN
jgi:hypothetical protein